MRGVFEFQQGSGAITDASGKLQWPHLLRVRVPKEDIGRVIRILLVELEHGKACTLPFIGELTRDKEEDSGQEIEVK